MALRQITELERRLNNILKHEGCFQVFALFSHQNKKKKEKKKRRELGLGFIGLIYNCFIFHCERSFFNLKSQIYVVKEQCFILTSEKSGHA